MVILKSQNIRPLILEFAKDCLTHDITDLYTYISEKCGLTETQKDILVRFGNEPEYEHNIRDSMVVLVGDKSIERQGVGKFRITDRGLIKNAQNIQREILTSTGRSSEKLSIPIPTDYSVSEGDRKYAIHRYFERTPKSVRLAKQIHGTTCRACGFNFEERYGKIGRGTIDIHHLTPLGTLSKPMQINPFTDVIPLCPNCHRIIHKSKTKRISVAQLVKLIR